MNGFSEATIRKGRTGFASVAEKIFLEHWLKSHQSVFFSLFDVQNYIHLQFTRGEAQLSVELGICVGWVVQTEVLKKQ